MGYAATSRAATASGKGKRRGFPPAYKRLTPAGKWSWLRGEECASLLGAGLIDQSAVSAEQRRLEKARNRLLPIVPSPARIDEYEAGYPFPPTADDPASRMRTADRVLNPAFEKKVLWPASYLEERDGIVTTFDVVCAETERTRQKYNMDGRQRLESPSAAALERLESAGAILVEAKLPTDDASVLRRQLARYAATGDLSAFIV